MRSPSPTRALPDNRKRPCQVDLGTLRPGDMIEVRTDNSRWYFTRTARSQVNSRTVKGVFIQTSSEAFGQITRSPENVDMYRIIKVGDFVYVDGRQITGTINEILVNGARQ